MGDVTCRRCGEPWDYYGARHGDMEEEEYKDLIAGRCCPCCKNKKVQQDEEEKTERMMQWIKSIDEGTDLDPLEFL